MNRESPMKECYVYMIRSGYGNNKPLKIGMADNPKKRIKELQTGNPYPLNLVLTIRCNSRKHARLVESTLHGQLSGVNVLGEWYKVRHDKLYKVLSALSNDPDCDVVERFNLVSDVDRTRGMLRSERKRTDTLKKEKEELERALSWRKVKLAAIRDHLVSNELMTHKEIDFVLKSIETAD